MLSGAWPFVVGGAICLVYSDNERDLSHLNSCSYRVSVYHISPSDDFGHAAS